MFRTMEVPGNTRLVEHGILNEQSDMRAHVCVLSKTVWVFKTQAGVAAINSGKWPKRNTYTEIGGVRLVTAAGYPIPPTEIQGAIAIPAADLIDAMGFRANDDTSTKGAKAVHVVTQLLDLNRFPLGARVSEITDWKKQVTGMDIHVSADLHIEVKLDMRGGIGNGATGNLYLQVAECNPYKRH